MMLFFLECKKILRSVIYWLFAACVLFTFTSEFLSSISSDNIIAEPQPGGDYYGWIVQEDPDILMPAALESLVNGYINNQFNTYPFGFIHVVHLKTDEQKKLEMILQTITGKTDSELRQYMGQDPIYYYDDGTSYYDVSNLPILVSYEEFLTLMAEADDLLGGGSSYAPGSIVEEFSLVPMSYEDALEEYREFKDLDHVTNGFARLFCDYHGIFLALLPVFPVAVLSAADRRRKMEQLIFVRKISSARLIMTRFAAQVVMFFLPVLVTALWGEIKMAVVYSGMQLDHLAMFKYPVLWLLPTIIAVTGIDMLITEIFSGIAAVLVQFIWYFHTLMTLPLFSNISLFHIIIRHNSAMDREAFMSQWSMFLQNRCFFTVLGIVCALLTVLVYNWKREGKFHGLRVLDKLFARKHRA